MNTYAKGRNAVAALVSSRRKRAFGAGWHGDSSAWFSGFRRACRLAERGLRRWLPLGH